MNYTVLGHICVLQRVCELYYSKHRTERSHNRNIDKKRSAERHGDTIKSREGEVMV